MASIFSRDALYYWLEDYRMRRIVLTVSLITFATPAFADAIDGDWCLGSKQLSVKEPQITLPSGTTIQGDYRRHEFLYQVPAGDTDPGSLIYLQLQGEDYMSLYHLKDGKPVDGQSWLRCAPSTTS
jgi:hypothetical protein